MVEQGWDVGTAQQRSGLLMVQINPLVLVNIPNDDFALIINGAQEGQVAWVIPTGA